ncbi:5-oxoprolinase subunit PxpB [Sphingobacterium griseoflavum]|uniref:5-oxoprolinase subunit PxpB n=1 Tax=Sphingobacterium griseoflavum TaxID=1474952 RepID=UPI001E386B91|nr:5-oxoprolinase subunit PxpB [Sphingobacterium griseoflavum]
MGEAALVVAFGEVLTAQSNLLVRCLDVAIGELSCAGLRECVSAYNTLTIYYDPVHLSYSTIYRLVEELIDGLQLEETKPNGEKLIPVYYNGPDLLDVAQHTGLSVDEIIALHTAGLYQVYMLGFVPGFPYLGGLDSRLATPRKATPRLKVAAGSVGIAGAQTGIYPFSTPGGWQIIGHTPLQLFDVTREDHPAFLTVGDSVRFVSMEKTDFYNMNTQRHGN